MCLEWFVEREPRDASSRRRTGSPRRSARHQWRRRLQWADEVQSPHGERPRDGDGLQSVGREVCLPGIELATLAGPHNVGGVDDRGGPVKVLTKCITHEGSWHRVVTANSGVDVPD